VEVKKLFSVGNVKIIRRFLSRELL